MQVILAIIAALFLGILAFMAYAMLFTVLLVVAAMVWVAALAVVLAARRSR